VPYVVKQGQPDETHETEHENRHQQGFRVKTELCPVSLSQLGWSLIPLEQNGKKPVNGLRWAPFIQTGTTPEQVSKWQEQHPRCNWAILLGKPSGGIVALDVDSPAAHRWVDAQGGTGSKPVWYETGRGWQYLFQLPPGMKDVRGVNPSPGVELRATGQYSVIPPSIHQSGKAYAWMKEPTGTLPAAPAWVIRHLTGQASPAEAKPQTTALAAATPPPSQPHEKAARTARAKELAGTNPRLLHMEGTKWLESSTFGPGQRNAAYFALAILYRGAGLSHHQAEKRLTAWTQKHTRPVYGSRPDNPNEPGQVVACAYRRAYGLSLERLRGIVAVYGSSMGAQHAQQLVHAFPGARRGQLIHRPMWESVARIIHTLTEQRVWKPTPLTHEQLAGLTGLTAKQVEHVAPFMERIGVRKLVRRGQSTVSAYSMRGLQCPPPQLIEHFGRWRGYRGPWKHMLVLLKAMWRLSRPWMKRLLNAVNNVGNWISSTLGGESPCLANSHQESASPRGPPPGQGQQRPSVLHLTGQNMPSPGTL
jgi:hypothetical protein